MFISVLLEILLCDWFLTQMVKGRGPITLVFKETESQSLVTTGDTKKFNRE